MEGVTFAVHDLVRIQAADFSMRHGDDAPDWVVPSLRRAPWVVVRRDILGDAVPVGIRGSNRTERFAANVFAAEICGHVTPENLCIRAARRSGRLGDASRRVAAIADGVGLMWGPVGSFGFELASGEKVTTNESDLDIVVRTSGEERGTLLAFLRAVLEVECALGVTIDAELDFEAGGVALTEYAALPSLVLAKTSRGPELIPCP